VAKFGAPNVAKKQQSLEATISNMVIIIKMTIIG
jgi:hypothetical protein